MLSLHSATSPLLLCLVASCSPAAGTTAECPPPSPDPAVSADEVATQDRPVTTVTPVEDLQSAFKKAIARAEPAVVQMAWSSRMWSRGPPPHASACDRETFSSESGTRKSRVLRRRPHIVAAPHRDHCARHPPNRNHPTHRSVLARPGRASHRSKL